MASKASSTIILSLSLLFWIALFVAGSTIPSDNVLQGVLGEGVPVGKRLLHLLGFVFTWTWSNILLLCCFASLVGEYGREAMSRRKIIPNPQVALVRGFFIFLDKGRRQRDRPNDHQLAGGHRQEDKETAHERNLRIGTDFTPAHGLPPVFTY
ncbi:MAG: hypothetical protein AAF564_22755, partial [Bacteroidota bacterium]